MLHRTRLIPLSLFSLILFVLAACNAPASSNASVGSAATVTERFAEQEAGGIHGWLAAAPAPPVTGNVQVDAYLESTDSQPVEGASVTFDIDMTNMSHGETLIATQSMGGGHYAGDVHFSMPGPWRIIATVERPGQTPVQLRFEFEVQAR